MYAKVKFHPESGKFYVYMPIRYFGIFTKYKLVTQPGYYNDSKTEPRDFKTYEDAKVYASSCSIDIKIQHKHDIKVTLDRL